LCLYAKTDVKTDVKTGPDVTFEFLGIKMADVYLFSGVGSIEYQ